MHLFFAVLYYELMTRLVTTTNLFDDVLLDSGCQRWSHRYILAAQSCGRIYDDAYGKREHLEEELTKIQH